MDVSAATLAAKSLRFLRKFPPFCFFEDTKCDDVIVLIGFCITQCVCVYEDVGRSSSWQQKKLEGEMFCVTG